MAEMSSEYNSLSGAGKRGGVNNENSTRYELMKSFFHSFAQKVKSPNSFSFRMVAFKLQKFALSCFSIQKHG